MRYLLLAGCCWLTYFALAQGPKPRVLNSRSTALFEGLTTDLDPDHLVSLYRTDLKLSRVRPNRHEPALKDSIMVVATPTDQLSLLKNRYKALLYSATITSDKISFAGMHIGVSKEQFCRALHLSPAYEVYAFTDGMENFGQLRCTFTGGKLKSVQYKQLVNLEAID
ncbi:MAG: hypothetical protein EOO56_27210 [Hymenobacter sp.]|nr:MAG: hypothetical protein EOO56_27210 [Hymenobacter sp.]